MWSLKMKKRVERERSRAEQPGTPTWRGHLQRGPGRSYHNRQKEIQERAEPWKREKSNPRRIFRDMTGEIWSVTGPGSPLRGPGVRRRNARRLWEKGGRNWGKDNMQCFKEFLPWGAKRGETGQQLGERVQRICKDGRQQEHTSLRRWDGSLPLLVTCLWLPCQNQLCEFPSPDKASVITCLDICVLPHAFLYLRPSGVCLPWQPGACRLSLLPVERGLLSTGTVCLFHSLLYTQGSL